MTMKIPLRDVTLEGNLLIPPGAKGVVIFAHGSGSSRLSPRNQFVAEHLRESDLGTLLVDLLAPEEDVVEERFNIGLLALRLQGITDWVRKQTEALETRGMKIGYFGASTGAAAALIAAAGDPKISAVVSRGGRPDLAGAVLPRVKAPTLLIVGGEDTPVIEMNREAFDLLGCVKDLVIVPGATHLFEEAGALEQVARHAELWFVKCLT
ncbi:MAG: dienelactone hydrolase family protein [Verrucomicrobia bacterium]|nr:dienelactone hydrolase family protein [Verrucomicrobiota bacterium]